MTPEQETSLIRKVDDIHVCLTGDPYHGKKGMIQEHEDLKTGFAEHEGEITKLKSWQDNVKLRIAFLCGVVFILGEAAKFGFEWVTKQH